MIGTLSESGSCLRGRRVTLLLKKPACLRSYRHEIRGSDARRGMTRGSDVAAICVRNSSRRKVIVRPRGPARGRHSIGIARVHAGCVRCWIRKPGIRSEVLTWKSA